ncbi:NADH dehydrogenase subunit 6 [Iris pallida]|uniref:NADH dehydrogenase subunit 6 (Plastid) n=1 Tax=Iris pallida TaxID=29817 RepID=A0AAX6FSF7_IRIPA|nr:NADH dehydrogenase subunit 6 [Iris pallida]
MLLTRSCSIIWFDFVVQIISYQDVSEIVRISKKKYLYKPVK